MCHILLSEGQIKEEKNDTSSPVNLKHGSPSKPDPSDTPMTEVKQSSTNSTTAMDEPLIIKVDEKPSHGHPERKRRASDDSIDVSNRDFYYFPRQLCKISRYVGINIYVVVYLQKIYVGFHQHIESQMKAIFNSEYCPTPLSEYVVSIPFSD